MPRVSVEWIEGKSQELRDSIAKGITQVFVDNTRFKPEQVTIVFNEHPPNKQYKSGKQWDKQ